MDEVPAGGGSAAAPPPQPTDDVHEAVHAAYGGSGQSAPPFTPFSDSNVAAARKYYERMAAAALTDGPAGAAAGSAGGAKSSGVPVSTLQAEMRALVLTPEAAAAEAQGGAGSWQHPVGAAAAQAAIDAEVAAAEAARGGGGVRLVLQRHQLGTCKGKPVYDAWAAVQLATAGGKSSSGYLGAAVVSLELLRGAAGLLHVANALEGGGEDPDTAQLAATVLDVRGGTRVAVFSPAMQKVLLGGVGDSKATQVRLKALQLQIVSTPPAARAVVLRVKPGATPLPVISDLPADQSSAAAATSGLNQVGSTGETQLTCP